MNKSFGTIRLIGKMLHVDCRIYGERVRHASKLADSEVNRKKLEEFFAKIETALNENTFRFRDYFPRAKPAELKKFAAIEAKRCKSKVLLPRDVTLKDYIEAWLAEEEETMGESKRIDYRDMINSRICPMIGHLSIDKITSKTLKVFVRNLKHSDGPRRGEFLSGKRMRNILTLLRRIYHEACCEHQWHLHDPFPIAFSRVKKIMRLVEDHGLTHDKSREVWLLQEWLNFIKFVPHHYRPFFECLRMGMIFSEAKALKKDHVEETQIIVAASNSRGVEKQTGKTTYRSRSITLTKRLKASLEQAKQSSKTEYVFTMEDGITQLNYTTIREDIWNKALNDAELPHRAMYSLRHTFMGWMVLLGMHSKRLKKESGHASGSKLSEDTYGDFRDGLLAEKEDILHFLGRDVLDPEEFKKSFPHIFLHENGIEVTSTSATMGLTPEAISELASMIAEKVGVAPQKGFGFDGSFSILTSSQSDNYDRLAS